MMRAVFTIVLVLALALPMLLAQPAKNSKNPEPVEDNEFAEFEEFDEGMTTNFSWLSSMTSC